MQSRHHGETAEQWIMKDIEKIIKLPGRKNNRLTKVIIITNTNTLFF